MASDIQDKSSGPPEPTPRDREDELAPEVLDVVIGGAGKTAEGELSDEDLEGVSGGVSRHPGLADEALEHSSSDGAPFLSRHSKVKKA